MMKNTKKKITIMTIDDLINLLEEAGDLVGYESPVMIKLPNGQYCDSFDLVWNDDGDEAVIHVYSKLPVDVDVSR